jgi:hypothetical protein
LLAIDAGREAKFGGVGRYQISQNPRYAASHVTINIPYTPSGTWGEKTQPMAMSAQRRLRGLAGHVAGPRPCAADTADTAEADARIREMEEELAGLKRARAAARGGGPPSGLRPSSAMVPVAAARYVLSAPSSSLQRPPSVMRGR